MLKIRTLSFFTAASLWLHSFAACGSDPEADRPVPDPALPPGSFLVTTGGPHATTPSVGSDGTLYVGSWDHSVYAIDPGGRVRWTFATNGRIDASIVVAESHVLVASWDGTLYALDFDGHVAWSFETGGPIDVAPAVEADGTIWLASDDARLHVLDAAGNVLWQRMLSAPPTALAIAGSSSSLRTLVATADGALHVLRGSEVAARIELPTDSGHATDAISIAEDGTAFFGTTQGHVVSITVMDAIGFNVDLTYAPLFAPAIGADGTLYVSATDHFLYALSAAGNTLWTADLYAALIATPTLGADGWIYASARSLVRVRGPGQIEELGTTGTEGSPVILPTGFVYANTLDGGLLGLKVDDATLELAAAPWPTARGNYRRTGAK